MTLQAKLLLKNMNREFFDDCIKEVIWSKEKDLLVIKMKAVEGKIKEFRFNGEDGKAIYKQLINPREQK